MTVRLIANDLAPQLDLDGTWEFDTGLPQPGTILVPGCWEAQGYPKTLDGPAYYRRTFKLPADWEGRPVAAEFDAVSYAADLSCNGVPVGRHVGLWTPFAVDLTAALHPGLNTLELSVTKPSHALTGGAYPMRTTLAGFLPDVATTFGGLWQGARLRVVEYGFADLQVDADPQLRHIRVAAVPVRSAIAPSVPSPGTPLLLQIEVTLRGTAVVSCEQQAVSGAAFQVLLSLPEVVFWSPAAPALYTVEVRLLAAGRTVAAATRRTGVRRLAAQGEQLLLNGEPICLRGALSWGWNPDVIAPCYTADQARAELRTLRAMGFNLVKLCLFIANQVFYDVADEEGMLLWQEWPLWLPDVTDGLRARAPAEYAEYMQLTRSHPAVVVYSLGCELDSSVDRPLLQDLDGVARAAVDHVLFCDNSGSGEAYGGLAEDFADFTDYHTYSDLHYLEPVLDHWRRDWQRPRPWLFGEFCDSDGFRERPRLLAANGGRVPWWLTEDNPASIWRPEMAAVLDYDARMAAAIAPGEPVYDLHAIAAAQSLMVRKYTLETVRKRRSVQGYVITGLIDTPIATSGVLNDFGDPKWDPGVFRQCNDGTILCLDTGRSRIWQNGGDRPHRLDVYNWWAGAPIQLYVILNHTQPQPIVGALVTWQIVAGDGAVLGSGSWNVTRPLEPSFPCELGHIVFTAPAGSAPQRVTLYVEVAGTLSDGGLQCRNQWPLWIFPRPQIDPLATLLYDPIGALEGEWCSYATPTSTGELLDHSAPPRVIATVLDEPVRRLLRRGGRVLLVQTGAAPLPSLRLPFWREAIKLLASHPLWHRFPHGGFADLQFFGLACDAAFDTDRLPAALPELASWTPILRRLDARQFTMTDYLFSAEFAVENDAAPAAPNGRLLACALRLQGGAGAQPTGLQCNVAGQYLLSELLQLLQSEEFL
ncbi:MAG: hypothetical protein U0X20_21625 [Caldilineaceae bacterium]